MGRLIARLAVVAAFQLFAGAVLAGVSFGDWTLRGAVLPDGEPACVAEVAAGGQKLSVWAMASAPMTLQFYAAGRRHDPKAGPLILRIVPEGAWRLVGASVMGPSIVVPLSPGGNGRALLDALSRGQEARLLTKSGDSLGAWPLSGSARALAALSACRAGLEEGTAN
ncbi:MAG: hypothetical protein D6688_06860 [Alphaproteobacteria bacterium]|nr:MAG: hypothetical protein D6688_06860 [Alphaproteobacteria bacterium]